MSIKTHTSTIGHNVYEITVEDREVEFSVDGMTVHARWSRNGQAVNGGEFVWQKPSIKLLLNTPQGRYEGAIWAKVGGGYVTDEKFWTKVNPERNAYGIPFVTIRFMVDRAAEVFFSLEVQKKMLHDTSSAAEQEIYELEERIKLLQSWRSQLYRELQEMEKR